MSTEYMVNKGESEEFSQGWSILAPVVTGLFPFFFSFCFFIISCKSSTHGHVLEQTPGDTEGQGNLVCRSSWGRKESDTTELLNNNNLHIHSRLQVKNKQKTNNPSSYKFSTQTGYLIPEHLKFFTLL